MALDSTHKGTARGDLGCRAPPGVRLVSALMHRRRVCELPLGRCFGKAARLDCAPRLLHPASCILPTTNTVARRAITGHPHTAGRFLQGPSRRHLAARPASYIHTRVLTSTCSNGRALSACAAWQARPLAARSEAALGPVHVQLHSGAGGASEGVTRRSAGRSAPAATSEGFSSVQ